MTRMLYAPNLGEKIKIQPQVLTSLIKPQSWLFHVNRDLKQGRRRRLRERCLKILFPVTVIIFSITPCRSAWKVWMRNPRRKLMRTVWTVKEKIENSSSCALVLHMTSNLIISRRSQDENGKEMYQNVKRTCRACKAIVFAYWICKFVAFSQPSSSSLLKVPVVLQTTAKKQKKVKNARAVRANLLFLPTKYANLWRSRCFSPL